MCTESVEGSVVCAVLGGAVEMERGPALPSGDDAFADFVFVNLRRDGRLRDFRQRETIALLHVENRVVAKNERNALIHAGSVFVVLCVFEKLLVKDNRCSVLAFADAAFQCLRLLERKPKWGVVFARPKQKNIDATVGFAGVEVAREWAACVVRRLPRLLPRNHTCLEAGKNAVRNGLIDARSAVCVVMVAVCHDVSLSCAARVGAESEGGHSPLALNQISFVECPASCLCGGQRRGGFGQGRAVLARLWSASEHP